MKRKEIEEDLSALNKEAEETWQNERICHLINIQEAGEDYALTLSTGKFPPTYHDVVCSEEGWRIKHESGDNPALDDIMTYVIMPKLFPSHGGARRGSGRKAEILTPLTVRISPESAEKIKREARNSGLSQGKYIESLLPEE